MSTCYILCNIHNAKSKYVVSNYAGSNMSFYLGSLVGGFSDVVFVNVGAPTRKWQFDKKFHIYNYEKYSIVEFPSGFSFLPTRFRAKKMIANAIKYIITYKKQGDKVLVYHSPSFSPYYKKIVKAFGINNSVLHVAELYSDVGNLKLSNQTEIKYITIFSKFIFMSLGIKSKIIQKALIQKSILIYGVYNSQKSHDRQPDDLIHVVYAGTNSKIKGGLFNALKASRHLPNNYVVHIFCKADNELLNEINSYNVHYGGYIEEEKLTDVLKTFDVGLSTQNPNCKFNESSFPSKIVTYLSCGLNVVSSESKSVLESPFNDTVFYYEEDDSGVSIADAIVRASKEINKESNQQLIKDLDTKAKKDIKELFYL